MEQVISLFDGIAEKHGVDINLLHEAFEEGTKMGESPKCSFDLTKKPYFEHREWERIGDLFISEKHYFTDMIIQPGTYKLYVSLVKGKPYRIVSRIAGKSIADLPTEWLYEVTLKTVETDLRVKKDRSAFKVFPNWEQKLFSNLTH